MSTHLNVVFMTADSLRADRVGCYGMRCSPTLTPNLDRVAAGACVFNNAFSQGCYTSRAMPALFSGRYPCRLKPMKSAIRLEHATGVLVEGTSTVTEILRDAGYHTAGFHSNPLLSRLFGFDKGFDSFFDDVFLGGSGISEKLKLAAARAQRVFRSDPYLSARKLHEHAIQWLKRAPQPFFLWIHYMDAHGPYLPRKVLKYVSRGERLWRKAVFSPQRITPLERRLLEANYHSQISLLDAEIGRFLGALDERVSLDSTLIVVTADHGDEFLDHGGFGHLAKPYDELLHVPLIVRLPDRRRPRRISQITETIEIAPTILDFAGIPYEHLGFDASSFLALLRGETMKTKGFAYSEAGPGPHDCVSIRTDKWKLIVKNAANGNHGNGVAPLSESAVRELYDLERDPREQINVAAQFPAMVAQLERHIQAHVAGADLSGLHRPDARVVVAGDYAPELVRNGTRDGRAQASPQVSTAAAELSEAERAVVEERLRDLGYI